MDKDTYIKTYTEDDAVGWLSIDAALENIYPNIEPRHFGPLCGIHYAAGGSDPIDGTSIYDSQKQILHRHIISYGMSDLYYNPEAAGSEFSNWGFEFTMRLKPFKDDDENPAWVVHMMNNLARYVIQSGRWFEPNQYLDVKSPIRLNTETEITGLALTLDPELGSIDTPNGKVDFIQLVGITTTELNRLKELNSQEAVADLLAELKQDNPLLITDLSRK